MLTPPDAYPNSGSSLDLLKRITQRLYQRKIDDQFLEILQQAFENEMEREQIVLSRPEKKRLFRQAAKTVLTDLLAKVDRDL